MLSPGGGCDGCEARSRTPPPSQMPGWTFDFGLWKGGTILVRRPPGYFDPDIHPEWLPLTFTPSPELYRAFAGDVDALVHHMRKLTEGAVRALRDARKGRPVIGAAALRHIHPWNEPRTMREPGGDRVPTFKYGATGLTAKQWNIAAALDTKRFRSEHRGARLKSAASRKTKSPRPGPRVRHRFTRGTTEAEQAGDGGASRVVVLRDRRRGRPKKSSDPPD